MKQKDYILKRKFESLFREHFVALCYFADKYTTDSDTSKEIVHNVFLKIWEKRDDFDFEKPAKSYLFTAVHNRCLNNIRDNKKFVTKGDDSSLLEVSTGSYEDTMETAELENRIKEAVNTLPEKCKEIFILSRFEELKYGEIAKKLDISVKTVEGQMSKALKILRAQLKDYLMILLLFLFHK